MKHKKKYVVIAVLCLLLRSLFALPVLAAETGDVAGAVEDTWLAAREQIKSVVNKVIFPIIDLILAVLFFVKLSTAFAQTLRSHIPIPSMKRFRFSLDLFDNLMQGIKKATNQ